MFAFVDCSFDSELLYKYIIRRQNILNASYSKEKYFKEFNKVKMKSEL